MNYYETCEYLKTLDKFGSVPGLDAISGLLKRLGDPQDHTRFVHISGTNGKGSVGSFISSILMDAGYSVGRFVSPAVWDSLEIIEYNGRNITAEEFSEIISRIRPICSEMYSETGIHPTRFEVETAASFIFFQQKKCDIAVIECGMGGLLDATNVISTTDCAVITSVSRDHMSFLGNTLEEIAVQKAGIIKPGSSVICMDDHRTRPVIESFGREHGMTEFKALAPSDIHIIRSSPDRGTEFTYKGRTGLKINMSGTFQPVNAALAIEASMLLRTHYSISDKNIRNGLSHAKWNGRFQIIGKKPFFILDGAHNDDGARALAESIKAYFPYKKITFIIGVFADKEYDKILKRLMPYAGNVLTIEAPENPRSLSSKKLAEYIKKYYDIPVYDFKNIGDAVNASLDMTGEDGIVTACGSLSHLHEVTCRYQELKGGKNDR